MESPLDWWAEARSFLKIAAILLIDSLALTRDPDLRAKILGEKDLRAAFETEINNPHGTYVGTLISGIDTEMIITASAEARELAPRIRQAILEKEPHADMYYQGDRGLDAIAKRVAPIIAASGQILTLGGPTLTAEKLEIINRLSDQ